MMDILLGMIIGVMIALITISIIANEEMKKQKEQRRLEEMAKTIHGQIKMAMKIFDEEILKDNKKEKVEDKKTE